MDAPTCYAAVPAHFGGTGTYGGGAGPVVFGGSGPFERDGARGAATPAHAAVTDPHDEPCSDAKKYAVFGLEG